MSDFTHDIEPPAHLENRVVHALRTRGLLSRYPRASRYRLAAAAAVLLFAAGYATGVWRGGSQAPAPSENPRFMLLLHETAATATIGVPERQLVQEYGAWARSLREGGHAIQGDKLEAEPGRTLSGFFIIEAPSMEAARALAASCPHARYGGRIEVREIEPT